MPRKETTPRGIRNNNPLNIRIGNTWLGEVENPTETEFEQFCSMEYGVRAAFVILRRYIRRYKRNTIRKIISSWAPSSENQTDKYIAHVSKIMKVDPDTEIFYEDETTMQNLVYAMAYYENGGYIDYKVIHKGYQLA